MHSAEYLNCKQGTESPKRCDKRLLPLYNFLVKKNCPVTGNSTAGDPVLLGHGPHRQHSLSKLRISWKW